MYRIDDYGAMYSDKRRMEPYLAALKRLVTPESVVLDLGAGTGVFSLLACQLGARRVFAVESDPAIQLARELAVANGFANRLECIQASSNEISLPERADVIISDLSGVLPWLGSSISSIIDARERHLAPSGSLIPVCDRIFASVVAMPEAYERLLGPWSDGVLGMDMRAGRQQILSNWWAREMNNESLQTAPRCVATLDYRTVADPRLNATSTWTMEVSGVSHGIGAWFDRETSEGTGFSNSPAIPATDRPNGIYGQGFFPWPEPVALECGDTVTVNLRADPIRDAYLWRWDTRIVSGECSESERHWFKQSTLLAKPLTRTMLHQMASDHVPVFSGRARSDQFMVSQMDGTRSLGEIAKAAARRFPEEFRDWHDALTRAGDLEQQLSR